MTDRTERILYFGGTFNPIHNGHLLCAQAVAEEAGYDRVVLIPSGTPPHRHAQSDMASAEDRLTMCHVAVGGMRQFGVSDIEVRRNGPSYTLATANQLRLAGEPPVSWLIGADTVARLPTWFGYPGLLNEVDFVVMGRPGEHVDWEHLDEALLSLKARWVSAPLVQISASDIRQRIKVGRGIDFHVPTAVADYIRQRRLYRL